jgi:hypothetical protein
MSFFGVKMEQADNIVNDEELTQSDEVTTETESEEEVVVSIDGETPSPDEEVSSAPEWVRDLRKTNRELHKKTKELEARLSTESVNNQTELGKKPKLDDFDYDADRYEAELSKWYETQRQVEERTAKLKATEAEQAKAWQEKLDNYAKEKTKLKVKDFEDAELNVQESFSQTQQGIVLQGSDNSALLIYALGKNPNKTRELAAITDPVKFAFAIAKLETQLKVANKKSAPPPEKSFSGSAPKSGTVDSNLERLRAEAEKTGNYSKVIAYKQSKK